MFMSMCPYIQVRVSTCYLRVSPLDVICTVVAVNAEGGKDAVLSERPRDRVRAKLIHYMIYTH